ncbi:hypothetical protein FA13DRAFT_1107991 [Coprinellus micaceus]|uniref:Uncharacterized protein n=1 Tax=Coprinellus micaceus TaxID=71717 RepID=A0A4Y7RK79_COPMI|nr:hypothetical protein FA13DRAFT_1107991 [Coprinellus micaceus]
MTSSPRAPLKATTNDRNSPLREFTHPDSESALGLRIAHPTWQLFVLVCQQPSKSPIRLKWEIFWRSRHYQCAWCSREDNEVPTALPSTS